MANSYGFDGVFPEGFPWGLYSPENGEWTGLFYQSKDEAEADLARRQARDGFHPCLYFF